VSRLPELIESNGLRMRRWRSADAELQERAVTESIDHLRPWMSWIAEEPKPLAQRRAMLSAWEQDWAAGGDVVLALFVDEQLAGSFGLHRRSGPETLELGYWIGAPFLRRGLATTASSLLTDTALSIPEITRVEIHHDKANTASEGIPRKLGFRLVEERPDRPEAPAEVGIECTWRTERTPAI
jgi:ribosomal-protein-serine acetyltransferase